MTFEQLVKNTSIRQKEILNAIWQHYLKNNQWPSTLLIHRDFGKNEFLSILSPLGGYVVREYIDLGKSRYALTLLGILLTSDGPEIELVLGRYLEFLLKKFNEDPEREIITSEQIYIALVSKDEQFNAKRLALLGKVVEIGGFLGYAGSNITTWTVRWPSDIDEWTPQTNFGQYLRKKIMENYDSAYPIDERGRALHQSYSINDEVELAQKFGILRSPNQAVRDFKRWMRDLGSDGGCIAVIFLDIDHFKALNTKYSNPRIDDSLLPEVLQLIERMTRSRGGAYHEGGDEFVIILPNHDVTEAMNFSDKIRQAFEKHIFHIEADTTNLTITAGVALWPEHGSNYSDVKTKACESQVIAKSKRNCVQLASLITPTETPLPQSGLSPLAQRLAVYLAVESKTALERDPAVDPSKLCEALEISELDVGVAADELVSKHWVDLDKHFGIGSAGFSRLWPTSQLFIYADPKIKGWNPIVDAKVVADTLTGHEEGILLADIDRQLSWGPRRLNPAVSYLIANNIVQSSRTYGAEPYISTWIMPTITTRRFAQKE